MIAAGARIGRFVVERALGTGGMGEVYLARDPELSRAVAIKVLHDRRDGLRLLREAQALARIAHPNVVAIHELGTHDDRGFVAMELVDGVTIDRYLAARPRSWREVLALYVQAGRGLAAVHAGGLVHRDVKPSNLLVDATGRVRVSDFGLAGHAGGEPVAVDGAVASTTLESATTVSGGSPRDGLDADSAPPEASGPDGVFAAPLTATGAVLGTPRYMAPEQRAGHRVTHHADQFSFCVALWEGLYGEHPFDGATRRPPPRGSRVPAWVARAVGRGLAPAAADRWPAIDALVDVLERTPRRRRLAAIAGGAVLAGSVAVVAAATLARAPARVDCARTGAIADRTWTAARRAAIADGHARDDLDRWAGRWRDQRVDACRATHERGEQSAAVLDRRVACLDAALIGFASLTDALGHADAAAARRAGEAIARLPAPEACSALRVAGMAPPSRDPRAAAVEQAIGAARAAVELRTPDARAAADRALADARALGEPGALARALALHAQVIAGVDAAGSRAELDQAQAAAATARDPALEAAVVLRGLAQSAATASAADRIDALLPVARAAVTRAGEPRPLQYELAQVEIEAAMRLARVDELRAACARAVELAPAEDVAVARASCACSAALLARDNAGAVTACADKVAALRARVGDEHPRVADAVHNQLTALVRAERFTDAAVAMGGYLALIERLYGARSRELAEALQLQGVLQERQGDLAASRATLERALAIVEEVGGPTDPGRVGLLMELATRAGDLGDVAAATRYADAGLAASERLLGADNPDLAVYLVFHAKAVGADPAQLARAIASWDRALAAAERSGPRTFTMGSILSSYAYFLANHERVAPALALAQRSLPIFDELGEALPAARAQRLIGELLLELRRPRDARAALTDARARFARLGPDVADELAEVERLLARAR